MSSPLTGSSDSPNKPSTPSFIGGVYIPNLATNTVLSLQKSLNDGFDYVVTDLPVLGTSNSTHARKDVTRLESKWWSTSVVGLVNDPSLWQKPTSSPQSGATYPGMELLKALTSTSATASSKRTEANVILRGMLEWASHMNIPAVILPPVPLTEFKADEDEDMFSDATHAQPININNRSAKEYARLLSSLATSPICTTSRVILWIRVPLSLHGLQSFQLLLARCDHNSSIGAMLYVDSFLDANDVPELVRELHLFCGGGNVKAISWDVSIFLQNKKGYPAFSKSHQFIFQLIFGRLGRTLRLLMEGDVEDSKVPAPIEPARQSIGKFGGGLTGRLHHLQYLRHLRSRPQISKILDNEEATIETPYLDHLQSPLQPLGDHLEYQTYETFEKDPVKYKNYGDAISYALEDGIEDGRYKLLGTIKTTRGELKKMAQKTQDCDSGMFDDVEIVVGIDDEMLDVDIHEVTILVVGAGRGPLVREAIRAVSRVSISCVNQTSNGQRRKALQAKIIAVEKNPSAILYLQSLKCSDVSWNGGQEHNSSLNGSNGNVLVSGASHVTIVGCDMRQAADSELKYMVDNPNLRGDIVVSELLGSFGDNELSPECLDGVQACGILKDSCVSIPQSYTAFIAPVSSTRLHNEAKYQSCHPLNPNEGPSGPSIGLQRAMETPYVVRSHAASQTHTEQECWSYMHPHLASSKIIEGDTTDQNMSAHAAKYVDNDRHAHLTFRYEASRGASMGCGYGASDPEMLVMATATTSKIPISALDNTAAMIHGLLGTFHSVLYLSKDKTKLSTISIAPHSFSVGMFSWFPLYFPLREPLRVPPKAAVNCSIWRRSDKERVWYEWCAEVSTNEGDKEVVLSTGHVHNPGGRSYHVRL